MKLLFQNVKLHNFLSYADAEFDLQDQNYCLVKGQNNCKSDNALSNGSGKSSWVSAICWCLTGKTIQGISSNIANIYISENSCYVELNFKADDKQVKLIRYNKPKSDLKIFIDDEDKSGKGIKDSEEQLEILFPDLTKELISSTILLGQGLPDSLSSLTPSGRKDMLEKLSKSDFMIEDIKQRVVNRETILSQKEREFQDNILQIQTQQSMHQSRLQGIEVEKQNLENTNYDEAIYNLGIRANELSEQIKNASNLIKQDEELVQTYTNDLLEVTGKKQEKLKVINESYISNTESLHKQETELTSTCNYLKTQIHDLDNIKDTCPTCGQKLPNVKVIDTTEMKNQLQIQQTQLNEVLGKLTELKSNKQVEDKKIEDFFYTDINNKNTALNTVKSRITSQKQILNTLLSNKQSCDYDLNKAQLSKQNLLNNIQKLKDEKANIENLIQTNTQKLNELNDQLKTTQEHIATMRKIITLIKRDFRGYLLTNVIDYINTKMKEYAKEVFDNTNVEFKLEGNNINIYLNEKCIETLSGGEKQKMNLLVQFAIRDMLETCLGYSSNILVLDEISDNLDAVSCDKIFNLISNKLSDIESIFIISHHANELPIPIDREILIIKNEQGISSRYC